MTMDLVIFEDSIKYDYWIMAVYWLILPRTIAASQESLILRFRAFSWNIPFAAIRSINPASGIIVWWAHSWITSYRSQIEIIRENRLKIRVSPSRRGRCIGACASAAGRRDLGEGLVPYVTDAAPGHGHHGAVLDRPGRQQQPAVHPKVDDIDDQL